MELPIEFTTTFVAYFALILGAVLPIYFGSFGSLSVFRAVSRLLMMISLCFDLVFHRALQRQRNPLIKRMNLMRKKKLSSLCRVKMPYGFLLWEVEFCLDYIFFFASFQRNISTIF